MEGEGEWLINEHVQPVSPSLDLGQKPGERPDGSLLPTTHALLSKGLMWPGWLPSLEEAMTVLSGMCGGCPTLSCMYEPLGLCHGLHVTENLSDTIFI